MARDRANINTNLWVDPDWRDLDDAEQRLYMLLTTHPSLSYAGVADWRPGRLAAMSRNGSREGIELAAKGLQAKRFVFIDEGTEEILIRSFLRHDGLLKQPKLAVSMANAFGAVASREIQMIIVNELQRLNTEHPDWKAFEVAPVGVNPKVGVDVCSIAGHLEPPFLVEFRCTAAFPCPVFGLVCSLRGPAWATDGHAVPVVGAPARQCSAPVRGPRFSGRTGLVLAAFVFVVRDTAWRAYFGAVAEVLVVAGGGSTFCLVVGGEFRQCCWLDGLVQVMLGALIPVSGAHAAAPSRFRSSWRAASAVAIRRPLHPPCSDAGCSAMMCPYCSW
jgi:hypothetical protein